MDETKQSKVEWIRCDDSEEIYTNQFFVNWSIVDVRIRFGQLIPTSNTAIEGRAPVVVEEQASVTMAWPQLKALRDSLNDALTRYERTNGPLDITKLKLPE